MGGAEAVTGCRLGQRMVKTPAERADAQEMRCEQERPTPWTNRLGSRP